MMINTRWSSLHPQWLTTLCWVEEKIYGVISLVLGFLTLMVWTLVWIVAAEAAEKPKVWSH